MSTFTAASCLTTGPLRKAPFVGLFSNSGDLVDEINEPGGMGIRFSRWEVEAVTLEPRADEKGENESVV